MLNERPQAPDLALGDWIECEVTHPSPRTLAACLSTPQALAEGRKMLRRADSGWRRATRDWSAGQGAHGEAASREAEGPAPDL